MYRRILLLCDLEGVNRVVGEPYHGLGRGTEEWEIARRQAAKELNAAADALYEAGASKVLCCAVCGNRAVLNAESL